MFQNRGIKILLSQIAYAHTYATFGRCVSIGFWELADIFHSVEASVYVPWGTGGMTIIPDTARCVPIPC
jgi:hypothetical protein